MSHDSQLQQAVIEELKWEPSVLSTNIGVAVDGGIVTLSGHVDSFAQKYAAEQAATRVKGIKGVAEEIEVQLAFDKRRTDDQIALAAASRLAWDVSIPQDTIKVKVEKGWITLTGQVNWYFEKVAAADNIRQLFGVIGVSNQINIISNVNAANISDGIASALQRAWFFEPRAIEVSTAGSEVILSGSVHSLHDWDLATSIAWSDPGTTSAQNNLKINH